MTITDLSAGKTSGAQLSHIEWNAAAGAINAMKGAGQAGLLYHPPGDTSDPAAHNLYGVGYVDAIGPRWSAGADSAPISDARPVVWVQKHSSANRTTNPSEWDQGAFYGALVKESGDAYGAGVTGHVRHESADGGQAVGVHGRGRAVHVESQVWGGWSYAQTHTTTNHTTIGHEVNVSNKAADSGWHTTSTVGSTRGLVVVTADGSNPITHAIYVGANSTSPEGKIHTGLLFQGGSIVPSGANTPTVVNNGEAVRIAGAASSADGYTGLRFSGGNLRTGISFAETTFSNNAAILMADDQRIVVGTGPASGTYLAMNKAGSWANLQGMALRVNGVQVVGIRKLGWAAATGTMDRTAWATYTAPTISATPTQAEVQALAAHMQVVSRHLAALQNEITDHGLIGA